MADSVFTPGERALLLALIDRGVKFLVVGASSAVLQGADTATQDVDLWFADLADPRIAEAVRAAGGIWISGSFGMRPPGIGGDAIGDRFDVVTHMDGLSDFESERRDAVTVTIDGIELPLLPIERIIVSKRAAGRPRDLAQVPALEEALAATRARRDKATD